MDFLSPAGVCGPVKRETGTAGWNKCTGTTKLSIRRDHKPYKTRVSGWAMTGGDRRSRVTRWVDDAEADVACGGVEDGGVGADGGRRHLGDLDTGDLRGRDLPGSGLAPSWPDPWFPADPIGEDRQQATDGSLPAGCGREGSAVEGADVGERPADDVGLVGVAGVEVGQADPYRPGSPCAGGASAA
jgi:hypothetical protein